MDQKHDPFDPRNFGGVRPTDAAVNLVEIVADIAGLHGLNLTGTKRIESGAAKVVWREKGAVDPLGRKTEGVLYQGVRVIRSCKGCGGSRPQARPFVHVDPPALRDYPVVTQQAIIYPWLSKEAVWDELWYSIRSVEKFFQDKDCPIFIIGDAPPKWFAPGGRIRFIRVKEYATSKEAGLRRAREIGVQLAERVLWWNDDIYLLRDCGWDDFKVALHEGDITALRDYYFSMPSDFYPGLGTMIHEMQWAGISKVMRFATHTPFLFERDKAREILSRFVQPHRGGFVSMYHNFHGTPHKSAKGYKVWKLPTSNPRALFLNHKAKGPDERTRQELTRFFGAPGLAAELVQE